MQMYCIQFSTVTSWFRQGEALEMVTTAAVCLFSTQTQLADQVPPLGHLPRILAALTHKNNAVPKASIRLIHVLSDNEVSGPVHSTTQMNGLPLAGVILQKAVLIKNA